MSLHPSLPVAIWLALSAIGFAGGAFLLVVAVAGLRYALRRERIMRERGSLEDGVVLEARRLVASAVFKTVVMTTSVGLGFVAMLIPPELTPRGQAHLNPVLVFYGSIIIGGLIVISAVLVLDIVVEVVHVLLAQRVVAEHDRRLSGLAEEER